MDKVKYNKIVDLSCQFIDSLPDQFRVNCLYGRLGYILNKLDGEEYKEFVTELMQHIAMGHELIDDDNDYEMNWFTVSKEMRALVDDVSTV